MKKAVYVILGLVLIAGAVGFFAYRQTLEGQLVMDEVRQRIDPDQAQAPRPSAESKDLRRQPAPTSGEDASGLRIFEMVINVLNIAVGLIGIWLAIVGTRMQRQAMQMQSSMTRDK